MCDQVPMYIEDNEEPFDEVEIKWNKDHDWNVLSNKYPEDVSSYLQKYDDLIKKERGGNVENRGVNPIIDTNSLNETQQLAHNIFVEAVISQEKSSTDGGTGIGRLQILIGEGGSGKSSVINAINSTLSSQGVHGGNFGTTGIAAVGIRG